MNTDSKEYTYLLVPGFLGNIHSGFMARIYTFFSSQYDSVTIFSFPGYEDVDEYLDPLDNTILVFNDAYKKIRVEHPDKHIVIIAHSQGCAVVLKSFSILDAQTSCVFLAPALSLNEVILSRLSDEHLKTLLAGDAFVKCLLAKDKYRYVNKAWVLSYKNFSLTVEVLKKAQNKILAVRPTNDFIKKEDAQMLQDWIPRIEYREVEGDHIFLNPERSFENLTNTIKLWFDNNQTGLSKTEV